MPVPLVASPLHLVGLELLDAVEPAVLAPRQVSWHQPFAVRPGLAVVATQRLDGPAQLAGRCALSQIMMMKERIL